MLTIPLYFKLIEEEHPEDYISLLSSAVVEGKKGSEEQERLEEKVKAKETAVKQLQSKLDSVTIELKSAKEKQCDYTAEIKFLDGVVNKNMI